MGRGGEKGPRVSNTGRRVDVEVVSGFLGPFSLEIRFGGRKGGVRGWVHWEETHLACPVSFCG